MDVADTNLPRWMQGDWASRAPLRTPQRTAPAAKTPAPPPQAAPESDSEPSPEPTLAELVDALEPSEPSIVELADALPDSIPASGTETRTKIIYRRQQTKAAAPRRIVPWLSAIMLAFIATIVLATQGLAIPERGLTVRLPDADPMPSYVPAAALANGEAADPTMLTPSEVLELNPAEAAAVREAIAEELAGHEGYQGPRPGNIPFRGATVGDRANALMCLTQAIYYEAANEPDDGQRAVAQVVLNRVRHPSYPNSICGVVYQGSERRTGCQFTFTCDGALARSPAQSSWARARRHAQQALDGRAFGEVGYATHYHTFEVWPYWGRTLTMTNMIGRHIFHRLRGRGGNPRNFTARYSGRESGPRPWRPRPAATAANADDELAEVVAAAARAAEQQAQEPNNLPPAPVARVEHGGPVSTPAPRQNRAPDPRVMRDVLPESTIRPEHRNSGQWIGD